MNVWPARCSGTTWQKAHPRTIRFEVSSRARKGDLVFVYATAPVKGIVALARITKLDREVGFWTEATALVVTHADEVVSRESMLVDPVLANWNALRRNFAGMNAEEGPVATEIIRQMATRAPQFARHLSVSPTVRVWEQFDRITASAARADIIAALAESIREANQLCAAWGVTLGTDFIRMNVGPMEVFIVGPEGRVRLAVDVTALNPWHGKHRQLLTPLTQPGRYRTVPDAVLCEIPVRSAGRVLERIRPAHFMLLAKAAGARSSYNWKASHSDDALKRIEEELGITLPRPTWSQEEVSPQRRGGLDSQPATPSEFSANVPDHERETQLRAAVVREGQTEFRAALLHAYDGRCAISGANAEAALEAAHIIPFVGPSSNHVQNGLLLRRDLHAMFDVGLLLIEPETLTVWLPPVIRQTTYAELHGKRLRVPVKSDQRPSSDALRRRWSEAPSRGRN